MRGPSRWIPFAVGACLVVVITAALVWADEASERRAVLNEYGGRLSRVADARAGTIEATVQRVRHDALFLAETPPVRGMAAATGDQFWLSQLQSTFLSFAKENPGLNKVRLIGVANNGMELVSVERPEGVIHLVPQDKLMARNTQGFFLAGLKLSPGETDVSDFILEWYHGRIATPHIPVFRSVAPVFNPDGKLFGVIVISADARPMFREIRADTTPWSKIYITNGDGDYILQPDDRLTFGFDLGARHRWQDDFKPLPREAGLPPSLTAYKTATGRVYAVRRVIQLGEGRANRVLNVTMTMPGSLIDARANAAGAETLFSVVAGVMVSSLLFYLYWRQNRRARMQQARMAALVEGASDAILGQTLDGVITDWNGAAERMFGYSPREAVGQTAINLITPAEYQAEESEFLVRVAGGETLPHFHSRRRRRDGGLLDVSVTVSPLYGADGRVVGASKTIRDISARLAAVAELAAVQARLLLTTQASGVGIWEWDVATESLRWDDTMLALYGFSREGFDGSYESWRDTLHPDDVKGVEAALAKAVSARAPFDITFRIRNPAGQVRHMRIKGAVSFDQAGLSMGLLGINIDITADREREAEIEALNTNLEQQVAARTAQIFTLSTFQRAILANAAHAIIGTDIDGVITVFNPAAERLFGCAAEEVIGKTGSVVSAVIRYDKGEMAARAAELTAELGRPIRPGFETITAKAFDEVVEAHEWTCLLRDGSRRPVLLSTTAMRGEDGEVFGYLLMLVDRSALAEQQRLLKENDRILRAVIENIPSIVVYWGNDLRFKFANQLGLDWFGRTNEQMTEINFEQSIGKELYGRTESEIIAALTGEQKTFETIITGPNGKPFHGWVHYVPVIADDEVDGVCVVVSDVTEIKKAQIELKAVNEALEIRSVEAEQATIAKSMFLANMSHEIRSPLNIVLGMLQLLSKTELSGRQEDYITKAYSSTNALLYLLSDMMDFSKIEAGKISLEVIPFGVEAMLRDLSSGFVGTLSAKSLELTYQVDANVPLLLRGDAFRIRQVLLNLIGNAIKFTQQGEVTASVRRIGGRGGRHDIEFSVRDTGIGIAPEQQAAVFEGFTQAEASTTRRFGGVGLGLAISKSLVALMGGDLSVESELGVGSRFWFTLSLEAADLDRTDAANVGLHAVREPAKASPRRLAGLRLLVVDDSELNLQVARELLSGEGAMVEAVDNGPKAIALTLSAKPPFDAVLMDIQMPDMDGFEAARRIRQAPAMSAMPIIAMTAHALASDKEACLAAGMNDHIAKPIDLDVMVATILAHCGSSPAAEPTPAVAKVPSDGAIDLDLALRRLGGNDALFRTISESFIRVSVTMLEDLRRHLREDSRREARGLLHTFKGLAGTVGLTAVAAVTSELERDVETEAELAVLAGRVTRLEALLARGIEALQRRLSGSVELVSAQGDAIAVGDAASIRTTLERLDGLLEGANLRALEVHAELRGLCGDGFNANLAPLAEAMARFDFKGARNELINLRNLWP
jgi:PAS domain S-box-containing protein